MATINGVEVIGDKTAHDFDLLDKNDGINLANGVERNRKATEDNHEDIVLHRTDRDVHVTPEWKNSLVTKEILGLYWTAAQTADIINEISIAGGAKLVKVDALPTVGLEQTIYLVPKQDPQAGDVFDEYVWVDGKFEFIGTTKVDLSNYATKTELNAKQDALSAQQLSNIADVVNKANDSDVVHKTGDETAAGIKTFSDGVVSNLINGKTPELIEEQGDGYIRYASGLQICWETLYLQNLVQNVVYGIVHDFPKPFISAPSVSPDYSSSHSPHTGIGAENIGNTRCNFFIINPIASLSDFNINYIAIGRWK